MVVAANALLLFVMAYCFGFASNLDPPWLVLAYQGTPLAVLRALVRVCRSKLGRMVSESSVVA